MKLTDWIWKLMSPTIDKGIKEFKNSKLGIEGEKEVGLWLEEIVGKQNFLRNVTFLDCEFDIDNVIVCDKGVIAVEVKNLSAESYFNDENFFYIKDGKRIPSTFEDPREEARRHCNALVTYLDKNGMGFVKINKVVVFANGKVTWDGNSGIYIIKDKEAMKNYLNQLVADDACTPAVCNKIMDQLKKLI